MLLVVPRFVCRLLLYPQHQTCSFDVLVSVPMAHVLYGPTSILETETSYAPKSTWVGME